jgi:phage tail-like protein
MTSTPPGTAVAVIPPRRGLISDAGQSLVSPLPASAHVPGMLLDDPLFMALAAALDDAMAPTVIGMDCLHYYLDPELTPDDFLPWLGAFVGVEPSFADGFREEIATAVPSYAHLGTAEGLRAIAARTAGVDVESVTIDEPGKVTWSSQAHAVPLPGVSAAEPRNDPTEHSAQLVITVRVTVGSHADADAIASVVTAELERVRPVHCVLQVEVTS